MPILTNNGGLITSVATGEGKTLQFASISAASSGDNTIVTAAGTGLKIKVVSYAIVADGAVTVRWYSGAGGTARSGAMSLAPNGGLAVEGAPSAHLLETAANTALVLNLGGAVGVNGHLSYFTEA